MFDESCENCGTKIGLDDQDVDQFCSIGCKIHSENTYYFSSSKKALKFCRIAIELNQSVNVAMHGNLYAVLALTNELEGMLK